MGVEELRAALEQEGRERVAALLREADLECTRLRDHAAQQAARQRARRVEREEAALRSDARERVSAVRRTVRQRVLAAREALLARVFEQAEEALSERLESRDAGGWLATRVSEALAHLPGGAVRLHASRGVAPVLRELLGERGDVRVEEDPALAAGFRASSADGAIVVDATAPALVEQARAALAIAALRELAREGTTAPDGGGP